MGVRMRASRLEGVQPKTGKDEKCFLKRSRKGEAAIKSRMVCVNSQNNLLR